MLTPEWSKSFGFREFDSKMKEMDDVEMCKAHWLCYLEEQRDAA